MVRIQWLICSACGHGHTFSLPVGEPLARAYGYNCPETGTTATMTPRGQWETAEHLSQGAVMLSAIPVEQVSPTP